MSTLGTDLPGHGEPQGVLPTSVRKATAANDQTRHGSPAGSTSPRTPQHDVVEMAKQAVDQRASSQGSPGAVPRSRWRRECGTQWRHGHGGAEQGAGRARPWSGRHALVGEASSSEAERAGGQQQGRGSRCAGRARERHRQHSRARQWLRPVRHSALASRPGW